jgi:adenine-specific DNA methylase
LRIGQILSDRGKQFVGTRWGNFCASRGILPKYTSAYHPECHGLSERKIITIKAKLRIKNNILRITNFPEVLREVTERVNESYTRALRMSPIEAMNKIKADPNSIHDIRRTLEEYDKKTKKNTDEKRKKPTTIYLGDSVLLNNDMDGRKTYLEPKKIGPYKVTRVIGENTFELYFEKSKKDRIINRKNLTQFFKKEGQSVEVNTSTRDKG